MNRPKFRLLIVEDNNDDVILLLRELKKAGYDVDHQVVCREPELRQALTRSTWDCVTSDHKMPQFTGHDAVRIVREVAPDLPLVIVSGELDMEVAVNLLKCGADDYVHKDELPRVVGAIESALTKSEISRSLKNERKRLRERERIFRSYFDLPVVGAAVLTRQHRIVEVNPYLTALLRADSDGLVGSDFAAIVGPDAGRVGGLLDKLALGELAILDMETSLVRQDKSLVPVRLSAHFYASVDDTPDYILCVVVDRSQEAYLRRQVEESLHFIDSISKNAPIAFYLVNCRTMDFEYLSEKMRLSLGGHWADAKRVACAAWMKNLHPNDVLGVPRFFRKLARLPDGQSLVTRFRLGSDKDGYRSFLSENTVYKRDKQGEPLTAFGVIIEDSGP